MDLNEPEQLLPTNSEPYTQPKLEQNNIDLLSAFDEKTKQYAAESKQSTQIYTVIRKLPLKITIPVAVVLLAYLIYILIDAYGSGTYPYFHKLRIRNDTSFVLANGSSYRGDIQLASGLVDKQTHFDIYSWAKIEATDFHMTTTPLGVVFDFPSSQSTRLRLMPRKDPTYADFGGKMNIVVSNPKKRRMRFEELWFNTGYWKDSDMLRDYTTEDGRIVLGQYANDTERMYIPSACSKNSISPVWVLTMENLKDGEDQIDMHPDGHAFTLNPLLFRNYHGEIVELQSTNFQGILGVDSPGAIKLATNHCNVSKILVYQDQAVELSNYSILVHEFRKQPSLYGIVGQFDEDFYYREFQMRQSETVEINITSDIALTANATPTMITLIGKKKDEILGIQSYTLLFYAGQCQLAQSSDDETRFTIRCAFT